MLRAGAEPADDGTGSIRYELHGLFFKGARDPDGKPAPGGARREVPWTVVPPVADAVRVLERIVKEVEATSPGLVIGSAAVSDETTLDHRHPRTQTADR